MCSRAWSSFPRRRRRVCDHRRRVAFEDQLAVAPQRIIKCGVVVGTRVHLKPQRQVRDAEAAADAEVRVGRRVHVIVEAATDGEHGVVVTVCVGEAEEAADVEIARVVVERQAAGTGELILRADTDRSR